MFYAWRVGLAEDVAYTIKPPSSQTTRSHTGKAKSYEPKALNETMGSIVSFHTSSTGPHQFPPPILTKVKEWGREKQRRPTPGARKSKQI